MEISAVATRVGSVRTVLLALSTSARFRRAVSFRGTMLVNGMKASLRTPVAPGDVVRFLWEEDPLPVTGSLEALPALAVMHENEQILVCEKPARLPMQPSRKHAKDSLAYRIEKHYREEGLVTGMHLVTRLDYSTSGIVLVAKNAHVHESLQGEGVLTKKYLAIVTGRLAEKSGMINAPIGRPLAWSIKRAVSAEGQEACTAYEVLAETASASLILATLLTGRTHQIRVHFASIGHPLVGDALYNPACTDRTDDLRLHAAWLRISSDRLCLHETFTSLPLWGKDWLTDAVLLEKLQDKKG